MKRRIVFTLAGLLVLAAILAFINGRLTASGNAGYVIIGLGDWALETSLYFVLIANLALFVALYLGIVFMKGAARLPETIKRRNLEARIKKSMDALLGGFVETIEGRWEKAERNLIRHAGDSHLPLLNYLTASRAAHGRGAAEQREEYLGLALKTAPQAELAIALTRAKLLMGTHEFDEAIERLSETNKSFANHPLLLRMLADAYTQRQDYDALSYLIPALREAKLLPEADLRSLEAKAYRALLEKRALAKDPVLIREIWRKVPSHVRIDPTLVEPYARGMIDAGVGDEVEEDLRLALGRDWIPALLKLYSRITLKDADRQLMQAEDWLGPHRDDPDLLAALALLAQRAGKTEKVEDYAMRSIEIDPRPLALKLLADVLHGRQDDVGAGLLYRQGLRLAYGEMFERVAYDKALKLLAPAEMAPQAMAPVSIPVPPPPPVSVPPEASAPPLPEAQPQKAPEIIVPPLTPPPPPAD